MIHGAMDYDVVLHGGYLGAKQQPGSTLSRQPALVLCFLPCHATAWNPSCYCIIGWLHGAYSV